MNWVDRVDLHMKSSFLRKKLINILKNYVENFYDQPHRKYHTMDHVDSILSQFEYPSVNLLIAAFFHDVVFIPTKNDNEEQSCVFLQNFLQNDALSPFNFWSLTNHIQDCDPDKICEIIMATKKPHDNHYGDARRLVEADFLPLRFWDKLIDYENKIFYEFQQYDIQTYITNRISFLKGVRELPFVNPQCVDFLINYVKHRTYNIGFFFNNFDPYHAGHEDIVQQAEKIFDKVILVQMKSSEKLINYRQIIQFDHSIQKIFEKEPNINKTWIRPVNDVDISYTYYEKNYSDFENISTSYFIVHKNINNVLNELE